MANVSLEDLTSAQKEVVELIKKHPDATQAELAEKVGVSAAAVGTRVSNIDGMDWKNRKEDVKKFFGHDGEVEDKEEDTDEKTHSKDREPYDEEVSEQKRADELDQEISQLKAEIDELSGRVDVLEESDQTGSAGRQFENRELGRKVLKVAFQSDEFTADEENELIETLT